MDILNENPWHHLPAEKVIELSGSHPEKGLEEGEVARRRGQFGANVVTVRGGPGPLVRFLLQFHQPLIYILLAAAVITAVFQQWVDASVILGVVLINAAIGFHQESRALRAIEALAKTLTTEATVVRAGRKIRIPSPDLVPGDVVLLQSGDKVPADLRLLCCRDLQVAEAALTGESVPVEKALDLLAADTVLADRKNMAYASTLVTYGQGTGVVVATGDRTEVGRISELIASAEELQTPLTRRIAHLSRLLLYLILGLAALNFAVGLLRGQHAVEIFLASVALAVAAIPEGLPAAVTITLAIGVAMGRSGTDVAREACDMVLTDDHFASIVAAVEEGRGVFDNLTKFIVWTLPTNAGEGLVILAAVLAGTALPIAPVQILWINMTTAVLLGLMLAFEPKEPGIMERPPRDPHAPILGYPLLLRTGLMSTLLLLGGFGLFEWLTEIKQATREQARTVAVNVFVFGQLFYLFNCRSLTQSMFRIGVFSNPAVIGGVLGMTASQLFFTYVPAMNLLFHSAPIGWDAWAALLVFGLMVYVLVEVEKRLRGHVLQGEAFKMPAACDCVRRIK